MNCIGLTEVGAGDKSCKEEKVSLFRNYNTSQSWMDSKVAHPYVQLYVDAYGMHTCSNICSVACFWSSKCCHSIIILNYETANLVTKFWST